MQAVGASIDQAVARDQIEPETIDGLERIRAVLTFCGKRLAGADSQLVPPAPLDGIASAWQAVLAEVQAFSSDGSREHVIVANAAADTVLAQLPAIIYPYVADDWNALRDAGVAYRATLEGQLQQTRTIFAQLQSDVEAERQDLAKLATDLSSERTKLASIVSEYQAQFSSAQETRNSQFAEAQAARQEKFGALVAEYTQRLADQNAEFSKELDASRRRHEDDRAELKAQHEAGAQATLDKIRQHEKDVETLVGVIGNLGVTSGYQKTANQARRTALVWQTITVVSMVGLIAVAYKAFLPVVQGSFTWEGFAGRVFLSLTVGVLAAYAGAQADRQASLERRSRKLALELEAIGPYLAPLPVEQQQTFRLQLGERSFGRDEASAASRDDHSPASVVDLLKSKEVQSLVREIVADAVKATRG